MGNNTKTLSYPDKTELILLAAGFVAGYIAPQTVVQIGATASSLVGGQASGRIQILFDLFTMEKKELVSNTAKALSVALILLVLLYTIKKTLKIGLWILIGFVLGFIMRIGSFTLTGGLVAPGI